MDMPWPWRKPRQSNADARLTDTKSATGFVALQTALDAGWSTGDFSSLAREGYMRNPVVFRAVRMIAETAAAIPWLLYQDRREIAEHPLLDLLERPGPQQAGATFFEALYGYLLIGGNAYLHLQQAENGARALHLLRPDRVSVETGRDGWPETYVYRNSEGTQRYPAVDHCDPASSVFGVLHLKMFHPVDDVAGFAPLGAALMALDTHNATGRWNKALLDNSARPSGALVYAPADGGTLTRDQFDRLRAELEEGYAGSAQAGRPMLLEGGLDWKAMSLSPKDMDFVEAKHIAAREIALAFGVPPMLLGIPGDNTYSNYQEANRAFYRMTVLPLVGRVARDLSAWLGPVFGRRLQLWYDADRVEGLAAERDMIWARVGAATFLTDDEKREAVGYGPRSAPPAKNIRGGHHE